VRPVDPAVLRWIPSPRRWAAATGGLAVLRAVLVVAQALLLGDLLARAFSGQGADPSRTVALLVVLVARAVVHGAVEWSGRTTSARTRAALPTRLLRHATACGPAWIGGPDGRGLTALVSNGVDDLDAYLSTFLPQVAQACVVPAAVLVAVGGEDWRSLLVLAATLPLLPVFLALVGMHTRQETEAQYAGLARLTDHFLDVVVGLPTLRAFGRSGRQEQVLRDLAEDHRRASMRVLRTAFLSALVLELLASLSVAVVAVFLGFRLLGGAVDLRTAMTVLLLAPEAYLPVRAVGVAFHAAASGLAVAARVKQVLSAPTSAPGCGTLRPTGSGIELTGLNITYPDGTAGLQDCSLVVAEGECVAVIGASGSGKSTLLQAVLGLVPVSAGRLRLGGVDVHELDLDAWRARVGYVPQRPWLVTGTLEDNLRLGAPDAGPDALAAALTAARVDEFLAELPDGLATCVGEGGRELSLGQLRRVALARALLRDAPVLLLDEPTADLDVRSEIAIVAALRDLAHGRTVLVTTHRLGPFLGWTRQVELPSSPLQRVA